MKLSDKSIDNGKPFDWGRTSADYAKYRDIYPQAFYDKIIGRGLCVCGQAVLDVGTGTGVLPRNLYRYGARWTAADISAEQIKQAKRLSGDMKIDYYVCAAEALRFPVQSFDVITACQCFWYFKHEEVLPAFLRMLKPDRRILLLYMAYLPLEDRIAGASDVLALRYSPNWSGAGETLRPIIVPDCYNLHFECAYHEEFRLKIPFTRETWHGRMKACRAIGASLTDEEIASWECAHRKLLSEIAPDEFDVLHYAAIAELKIKA